MSAMRPILASIWSRIGQWLPTLLSLVALALAVHLFVVLRTLKVPIHKYGAAPLRDTTLAAGNGISTAEAELATGQAQWTITNTSPGGGGGPPTGAAGGDLGGTYPNPTVVSVADVTTGVLPAKNGGWGRDNSATGSNCANLEGALAYWSPAAGGDNCQQPGATNMALISTASNAFTWKKVPSAAGGLGSDQSGCSALVGAVPFWSVSNQASCSQASGGDQLFYTQDGLQTPTWGKPFTSNGQIGGPTSLTNSFQRIAATTIVTPSNFAGNFVANGHCQFSDTHATLSDQVSFCLSINSTSACTSVTYQLDISATNGPNPLMPGSVGMQTTIAANTTDTIGLLAEETVSGIPVTATCDVEAWITQ